MSQKYIKILTFLGLIAIVAVQSLWLVNTYQLIDGKIRQACSRLFPKSVLDEVADRLIRSMRSLRATWRKQPISRKPADRNLSAG